MLEPHQLDEFVGDVLDLLARQLALARAEADILPHRHPRKQGVVLEHHAAVAAGRGDGFDLDQDFAGGGLFEARDHAQQGRLAAARSADQAHERASLDRRVDARERFDLAVADLKALAHATDNHVGPLGATHGVADSTAARDC